MRLIIQITYENRNKQDYLIFQFWQLKLFKLIKWNYVNERLKNENEIRISWWTLKKDSSHSYVFILNNDFIRVDYE